MVYSVRLGGPFRAGWLKRACCLTPTPNGPERCRSFFSALLGARRKKYVQLANQRRDCFEPRWSLHGFPKPVQSFRSRPERARAEGRVTPGVSGGYIKVSASSSIL